MAGNPVDGKTASKAVKTKCRCPKCGEPHFLKICWLGRGIPPKYCESCKKIPEVQGADPNMAQGR